MREGEHVDRSKTLYEWMKDLDIEITQLIECSEFVNQPISDGVGHKILLFRREPHYHMVWSLSGDLIYSQPVCGPQLSLRSCEGI